MAQTDAKPEAALKVRPCPICGKPASLAQKPFCSPRCADVDLNRWLGGVYAIPGALAEEEGGEHPRAGGEDSTD